MPRVIHLADPAVIGLEECVDSLARRGFDPHDEESLHGAARDLRRLGNDRAFLGDILLAELKHAAAADPGETTYDAQTIVLSRVTGDFFLRANIWPSPCEHAVRASGEAPFYFDLPHDHNFSFLSLGYFGPGYWSDYYEYDFDRVAGYRGEAIDLRFVERSRLSEGKLMLYRAHRDVHVQHPADALSVSLNVMHMAAHQSWFDQYRFDVQGKRIAGILNPGSSEVMLRLAVGLGGDEAIDLAERFGCTHPSDRMRLASWEALALAAPDTTARDALWARAEAGGSRMIAGEARRQRGALVSN